jgi:ABC-type branched-subunit amino acid transport system substrate-binding protein
MPRPGLAKKSPPKFVDQELNQAVPEMSSVSQYLAAIGRRGGIKGGKVRAEVLTGSQRKLIAQKAAQARWAGKK